VYDSRDRRVDALSIAELGLAAPMLGPFRIAQAAVQLGDFKLSDGGFGSLHTEAACCGSAPRHTGASASSTVDFGIFNSLVSVHVEMVRMEIRANLVDRGGVPASRARASCRRIPTRVLQRVREALSAGGDVLFLGSPHWSASPPERPGTVRGF